MNTITDTTRPRKTVPRASGKPYVDDRYLVSENMIMWAFRYALGRRTGAVDDVCSHLKTHWDRLRPFTQNQIQEEIRDAFRVDRAGDHCDIVNWQEILHLKTKEVNP